MSINLYQQQGKMKLQEVIIWLLFLITLLPVGCAATSPPNKEELAKQQRLRRLGPEVELIQHQSLDLQRVCSTGYPRVEVRFAREADLPRTPFPSNTLEGLGSGAGIATIGIYTTMLAPMAQGAAVGGIILGPTYLVMGIINQSHFNTIKSLMEEVDLPTLLQRVTQKRLKERFKGELQRECSVEIMILSYGLIDDGYTGHVSFTFDAELRVISSHATVFEDKLLMGPFYRSDDLPPPERASFGSFGADEGVLTRRTLEEAAEIMAAAIACRLKGK